VPTITLALLLFLPSGVCAVQLDDYLRCFRRALCVCTGCLCFVRRRIKRYNKRQAERFISVDNDAETGSEQLVHIRIFISFVTDTAATNRLRNVPVYKRSVNRLKLNAEKTELLWAGTLG